MEDRAALVAERLRLQIPHLSESLFWALEQHIYPSVKLYSWITSCFMYTLLQIKSIWQVNENLNQWTGILLLLFSDLCFLTCMHALTDQAHPFPQIAQQRSNATGVSMRPYFTGPDGGESKSHRSPPSVAFNTPTLSSV